MFIYIHLVFANIWWFCYFGLDWPGLQTGICFSRFLKQIQSTVVPFGSLFGCCLLTFCCLLEWTSCYVCPYQCMTRPPFSKGCCCCFGFQFGLGIWSHFSLTNPFVYNLSKPREGRDHTQLSSCFGFQPTQQKVTNTDNHMFTKAYNGIFKKQMAVGQNPGTPVNIPC